MVIFNERLKELRKDRDLTQVQLAAELGVSKQNISDWENKKSETSIEMLIDLAKFFEVTVGQLVGTEDLV